MDKVIKKCCFTIGEFVTINESFPKQIVIFKIINGFLCAGFNYGEDGILFNQIKYLKKYNGH